MAANDSIRFDNGVGFINKSNQSFLCSMTNTEQVTIPKNGWVIITGYRSSSSTYGTELKLDNSIISNINSTSSGDFIIPVKKDQILSWNTYARGDIYLFSMKY